LKNFLLGLPNMPIFVYIEEKLRGERYKLPVFKRGIKEIIYEYF